MNHITHWYPSNDIAGEKGTAIPTEADLRIHVYKLSVEIPEEFGGSLSEPLPLPRRRVYKLMSGEDGDEPTVPAASSKDLPARDLENVWEK